jgi:single-strand DNA-binding protein
MLIGRLTKDPEPPRTLPNGQTVVVKFRFAVGRSKKVGDNWEKDPNQLYIDCEVFHNPNSGSKRNLPELITKFVKQGDPLYIEGRLVFEEWEDKKVNPPQKRSKHKLVVDGIEFLGGRNEEGGGGGGRQTSSGRSSASAPQSDEGSIDDFGGGNDGGSSGGGNDPIPF